MSSLEEHIRKTTKEARLRDSPNPRIDRAIRQMMKGMKAQPPDVQVKIIAQAISWEKCKHHITESDDDFNPDAL